MGAFHSSRPSQCVLGYEHMLRANMTASAPMVRMLCR